MTWMVVINADGESWPDGALVPIDPPSGWVEAWDGAIPTYQARRYDTEEEANMMARRFRVFGFSAATERSPEKG